jgi:hypothetical protein
LFVGNFWPISFDLWYWNVEGEKREQKKGKIIASVIGCQYVVEEFDETRMKDILFIFVFFFCKGNIKNVTYPQSVSWKFLTHCLLLDSSKR